MATYHTVKIGNDDWTFAYDLGVTRVQDEMGDTILRLPNAASPETVKIAVTSYLRGLEVGKKVGAAQKLAEIQRVLGIKREAVEDSE